MNWLTVIKKGALGLLTFVVSYAAANTDVIVNFVTNLIPAQYVNLTVGGLVAAIIVAVTNWLKNRNK